MAVKVATPLLAGDVVGPPGLTVVEAVRGVSISQLQAAWLNQQLTAVQPMQNPNGFTFTSFGNLEKFYDFTQGALPPDWNVVLDDVNNYAPANNEYTADQVTTPQGATVLKCALDSGGFTYKGGLIGTIAGGNAGTVGTPTYTIPQAAARVRYLVRGPQFAGAANANGLWCGCWSVSDLGIATSGIEIDGSEINYGAPTTSLNTLHNWKPTPVWQSPGTGTTLPAKVSQNAGSGYHWYGFTWELGKITWELDNVAVAQYTSAQAASDGHTWNADTATPPYLLMNASIDTGGIIGPAFNPADNGKLAAMSGMQIAASMVYTS